MDEDRRMFTTRRVKRRNIFFLLLISTTVSYYIGRHYAKHTIIQNLTSDDTNPNHIPRQDGSQLSSAVQSMQYSLKQELGTDLLSNDMVHNVVHYLWCGERIFEFQHYLSFKSVIHFINPERIIFHYSLYPRHDNHLYNTWFEDIKQEYPYIELDDLGQGFAQCKDEASMLTYIKDILNNEGGIYVQKNTIFSSFPIKLRKADTVDAINDKYEGFFIVKAQKLNQGNSQKLQCVSSKLFQLDNEDQICAIRTGLMYPRETWEANDPFSLLARFLLYGQFQVPQPIPNKEELIPNIAHMLFLGSGEMDFLFYLSCLSLLHLAKVDYLYIHITRDPPSGKYWDKIKDNKRLKVIKRPWPNLVYRQTIQVWQHMSDIFAVDIMQRYGGIYSDIDVIWTKPLSEEVRAYDAVLAYDWPKMHPSWPDYVNCGVMLGKPNAKYWKSLTESFRDFKDDLYGFNCLRKPYKIYEKHPDQVFIHDRLQMICWNGKCHPTWQPNFRDPNASHIDISLQINDVGAFHFVDPAPEELMDETKLFKSNSMFANLGKEVLKAAERND